MSLGQREASGIVLNDFRRLEDTRVLDVRRPSSDTSARKTRRASKCVLGGVKAPFPGCCLKIANPQHSIWMFISHPPPPGAPGICIAKKNRFIYQGKQTRKVEKPPARSGNKTKHDICLTCLSWVDTKKNGPKRKRPKICRQVCRYGLKQQLYWRINLAISKANLPGRILGKSQVHFARRPAKKKSWEVRKAKKRQEVCHLGFCQHFVEHFWFQIQPCKINFAEHHETWSIISWLPSKNSHSRKQEVNQVYFEILRHPLQRSRRSPVRCPNENEIISILFPII